MYLAGIDIGTTGCKCSVYDDEGNFFMEEYEEYRIHITKEEHTIDAEVVWEGIKSVIKKITRQIQSIEAICVTSFGEASVLLDKDGTVLDKSYLFTDPNGQEECDEITATVGRDYIYENTGIAPGKMYSVCKWCWQKRHKPEIWKKVKYICLFEDYIVYKLTGVRQIDYSLATRTMAFDIYSLEWDTKILDAAEIDVSMLSKVVPIGAKAGNMSLQITEELGFMNRPVIVSGCHDQIAAAIGSGVFNERHGVDGTGTVECITVAFSKGQKIDKMLLQKSGFAIVPYMKDLFVTYAFSYTGGALLKWYRDKVSPMEAKEAYENGQNPYEIYNRGVSDGEPSELLILPYFAGAGTPYMDNSAKGIIAGLTMDTSKEKIYQGIMEGCSYEMKLNLDYLQKAGIAVEKLFATGGGANSKEWLHIKADIYDKEIISLGAAESGTVACILLAGAACGRFRNLEEASKVFITYRDTYFPRKGVKEKYKKLFDQYRMIYPRLYEK